MKKHLIILTILSLYSFLSCNSISDGTREDSHIEQTLRLDNGKKWSATGSMTDGIKKLNTIVTTLNINTFDQKKIGHQLNLEIRKMMTTCTATGEAHNQFHYYLDPLKEQINGLKIANEIAKRPLLSSIKTELENYNNYFN